MPNDARRILLLEAIHDVAAATFSDRGYDEIISIPRALSEDELLGKLPGVHLLGIRSRTRLSERALAAADRLLAIGCFCIGTSQVDIPVASRIGIPVFNAPFSSTRSVAELVMAEIIMLMRGIFPKSQSLNTRGRRLRQYRCATWNDRGERLRDAGYILRCCRQAAFWKCPMHSKPRRAPRFKQHCFSSRTGDAGNDRDDRRRSNPRDAIFPCSQPLPEKTSGIFAICCDCT
jgi:lactate dehydrogenase-like 2-hydroxyacid dehydrogenase